MNRWVAYVGSNPEPSIGPNTKIIDATSKLVIPGLIDGHTHLACLYTAETFLAAIIPGGTTAIVTETTEPYAVCGYRGVEDFMGSFANQPIHVLGTAPPMVSISSNFPPTNLEELRELLIRVDMIGLGESYWQKVISAPDQLLPVLDIARSMGSHSPAPCREDLSLRFRAGTGECEFCLKK